ncbi:MAG: hypothetical protein IJ527_01570 [Prevotella sp.]|nr:hypothetical protein [Prevotella sp.]
MNVQRSLLWKSLGLVRHACLVVACLVVCVCTAQNTELKEEGYDVEFDATQTEYGFFGTTNAVFSESTTVIATFSLTQNAPRDGKVYPTVLSIYLQANNMMTQHQEQEVRNIAQGGQRTVDGKFPHKAVITLDNDKTVNLRFAVNNLTEGYTHSAVMLTAPIYDPADRDNRAMFGELATELRQHDIRTLTILGSTLDLLAMGFHTANILNGICQELMLKGCSMESMWQPDRREVTAFDVSGFRSAKREKTIDELVFHALGCFPQDIRGIRPSQAKTIISENTEWLMDDNPDYHELEFTSEDGYDHTYLGLRMSASMCWGDPPTGSVNQQDNMPLTGYNYYFRLYSKDKKQARASYETMCDDLEALGFHLQEREGDRGDKDPLAAELNGLRVETCYYLNVRDEYVIALKINLKSQI